KYLVHLDVEWKRHVVSDELELVARKQMLHIAARAGEEIVDTDHIGAVLQQPLGKMRSEKAGPAGDQYARFQVHLIVLSDAAASGSVSVINIVETLDVIFPEIASGLHLDELKWNLAGVGEPVNGSDGDIRRLVFVDDIDRVADRDFRSTSHNHPMFGPVQ